MTVEAIWEKLAEAVRTRKSLFHTPAIATFDGSRPEVRTVVLRDVDAQARTLRFHTDQRASKVEIITEHPSIAWHFYDPAEKLQIRMQSQAVIHRTGPLVDEAWAATRVLARRCYLSEHTPGVVTEDPYPGFPLEFVDREPTEEESAAGKANFCCVVCTATEIETLQLHFKGHERQSFRWTGSEWQTTWLAP